MYLSVVIPCFNEQHALGPLHHALVAVLPRVAAEYEVILVDDGSTDRTLWEARTLAASNSRFQYVSLSRNFGKESAILAGLQYARGLRVAIMDADLQHPPALLERMLPLLETGYDQVVARRSRDGEWWPRALLSKLYYWGLNKLSDVRIRDGAGDFRVLSRRAVDALLSLPEYNRFSKGLFSWIGFETVSVSYRNVPRGVGRSKWTLGALVNHAIDGMISFNHKPLRLSIYLGSLATFFAFLYLGFVIVNTILDGVDVPGYATLMAGVVGLGGLHLLFLGVIGEYLGKIYFEAKRRPHFLVKDSSVSRSASAADKREVASGPTLRYVAADP
jgi:glycosyltransferase involved in cell wall biosynthesis